MAMWSPSDREPGPSDLGLPLRALANEKRMMILNWPKNPLAHFEKQQEGDLVSDGVCGLQIAEKLHLAQPTVSVHLNILARAGLLRVTRIKQWSFYTRDENRIREIKEQFVEEV